MTYKRAFRKRQTFNSSYYQSQKVAENSKHYSLKRWIADILKTYDFWTHEEYSDPQLLAPTQIKNVRSKPYQLDVLAYNYYRNEILTVEVHGPYHFKDKQLAKDKLRLGIIIDWIECCFSKVLTTKQIVKTIQERFEDGENTITTTIFRIKNDVKEIVHRHVELSRNDIYKGFLDYEGVISLMRL